jgi:dihydrofolate reductase
MAKLHYTALTSLDGYIEDESGSFDWAMPSDEVHQFANDLDRRIGTHLYGRRLYDVMTFWETAHEDPDIPPVQLDYARVWQSADKVVYSRTLEQPSSARTTIEHEFDPTAIRVRKASAEQDLAIGGAELAGLALREGLVDELHLLLAPVLVGGGKRALPDGVRLDLELLDERRFDNGVAYLHYRIGSAE